MKKSIKITIDDCDTKEEKTEYLKLSNLIRNFDFNFSMENREEILKLLKQEIYKYKTIEDYYRENSSEYIRFLCGYLFCIGNTNDIEILEYAKYKINMDVGCMIDYEWLARLELGSQSDEFVRSREDLIQDFVDWYSKWI